jgi:hypothetical protein
MILPRFHLFEFECAQTVFTRDEKNDNFCRLLGQQVIESDQRRADFCEFWTRKPSLRGAVCEDLCKIRQLAGASANVKRVSNEGP